jgi:hypothetical protein
MDESIVIRKDVSYLESYKMLLCGRSTVVVGKSLGEMGEQLRPQSSSAKREWGDLAGH